MSNTEWTEEGREHQCKCGMVSTRQFYIVLRNVTWIEIAIQHGQTVTVSGWATGWAETLPSRFRTFLYQPALAECPEPLHSEHREKTDSEICLSFCFMFMSYISLSRFAAPSAEAAPPPPRQRFLPPAAPPPCSWWQPSASRGRADWAGGLASEGAVQEATFSAWGCWDLGQIETVLHCTVISFLRVSWLHDEMYRRNGINTKKYRRNKQNNNRMHQTTNERTSRDKWSL